jgi:hypothetical protein
MFGGQHRNDEGNGPSRRANLKWKETENRENKRPALLRRHAGVLRKSRKLRQNVLDGVDFARDVLDTYLR